MPDAPDPFWLILGLIAVLTVVLFPIRRWRQRRHRYGDDDDEGAPPGVTPRGTS